MTVRTNPPGALLYVDDYLIGETPISTNFTYYGQRKIRLVKDGFETLTVLQSIPAPWYEYTPVDFVAENFVPGRFATSERLDFQLKPQVVVPTEQLLSRAEDLRRGVHTTTGTTASHPEACEAPQPLTSLLAASRHRTHSDPAGRGRPACFARCHNGEAEGPTGGWR